MNVGIVAASIPAGSNAAAVTAAPTGSLTLLQGTTVLATIPDLTQVTPSTSGYYTLTGTGLPVGSQTLKVVYSGDSNYSGNSASLGLTSVATLTTSVSTSYSTTAYASQPYTVNAIISGTLALGLPRTGTLTLQDAGGNTLAQVNIATATPNASGWFALTVPGGLAAGTATGLQVVYSGDSSYAGSSQTLKPINVSLVPDSVALSYSTPQAGQPLTINAKINGTVVTGVSRTGTLTLSEGVAQLRRSTSPRPRPMPAATTP